MLHAIYCCHVLYTAIDCYYILLKYSIYCCYILLYCIYTLLPQILFLLSKVEMSIDDPPVVERNVPVTFEIIRNGSKKGGDKLVDSLGHQYNIKRH